MYADYRRAFALNPELAARVAVRTLVRTIAQDPVAALAACDEHLENRPDDFLSYARRGLTLLFLNREDEAHRDLDEFRRRSPENAHHLQLALDLMARWRDRQPRQSQPVPPTEKKTYLDAVFAEMGGAATRNGEETGTA